MPPLDAFTPVPALLGGILIGLSASLLLAFDGRIAGVSGIVGGLVRPRAHDWSWRAAFVLGLVAGGAVLRLVDPAALALAGIPPLPVVAVAGLLVGVGTHLGNGCTSGHGVCGIGRGSLRSVVATMVFMLTGAATVWLTHGVLVGR